MKRRGVRQEEREKEERVGERQREEETRNREERKSEKEMWNKEREDWRRDRAQLSLQVETLQSKLQEMQDERERERERERESCKKRIEAEREKWKEKGAKEKKNNRESKDLLRAKKKFQQLKRLYKVKCKLFERRDVKLSVIHLHIHALTQRDSILSTHSDSSNRLHPFP